MTENWLSKYKKQFRFFQNFPEHATTPRPPYIGTWGIQNVMPFISRTAGSYVEIICPSDDSPSTSSCALVASWSAPDSVRASAFIHKKIQNTVYLISSLKGALQSVLRMNDEFVLVTSNSNN